LLLEKLRRGTRYALGHLRRGFIPALPKRTELQRLKPLTCAPIVVVAKATTHKEAPAAEADSISRIYVAAEAATHKDSRSF
jgi:hypothetical protein